MSTAWPPLLPTHQGALLRPTPAAWALPLLSAGRVPLVVLVLVLVALV
jgi:hypothetical protein